MENTQQNFLNTFSSSLMGQVRSLTDPLPDRGVALEIIKRIAVVVIAPFALLALAFGKVIQSLWTSLVGRATARELNHETNPNEILLNAITEISDNIVSDIVSECPLATIYSLKIYITIRPEGVEPIYEDFVVSTIQETRGEIEAALKRASANIESDKIIGTRLEVTAFSKTLDKRMEKFTNEKIVSPNRHGFYSGNANLEDSIENWNNSMKLFFETTGREYTPQLDENGDFFRA
jgi:hypothetical protein